MQIKQLLPLEEEETENIILMHKLGVIIAFSEKVYQVKIFREPQRKIFSTSLESAYRILKEEEEKRKQKEDFLYSES
ncbi:MAG: hypothetical protein ACTSX6_12140 [Candidatus Heimdallarchaeaceae archaeon]